MRYYPIFVNLSGKKCLVVGVGEVGLRKIAALASCGPEEILALDLAPLDDKGREALSHPSIIFQQRSFERSDLDGRFIVMACTDSEDLNWEISRACAERGVLCNIVDQPEKCSFIVPALFTQGDLTMAVSTGGSSPAMARKIRRGLHEFFGSEYGALLLLMNRLRPKVLGLGLGTKQNSALFRTLVDSELLEAMAERDADKACGVLRAVLPAALHSETTALVDGVLADTND